MTQFGIAILCLYSVVATFALVLALLELDKKVRNIEARVRMIDDVLRNAGYDIQSVRRRVSDLERRI